MMALGEGGPGGGGASGAGAPGEGASGTDTGGPGAAGDPLEDTHPLQLRKPALGSSRRQVKYRERWYVDLTPGATGEFLLKQTRSDIIVAVFPLRAEAEWVCNKLNHGRDLCEAVRNALNVDDWLERHPNAIIQDLQLAIIAYTKDND